MARFIEANDTTKLTPRAHLYTPDQVRQAFNLGLALLEDRAYPIDDIKTPLTAAALRRLAMSRVSLEMMGFSEEGLSSVRGTEGNLRHVFSRTGEEIEFESGVFAAGPINELNFLGNQELLTAKRLTNRIESGVDIDPTHAENHLSLAESYTLAAQILEENSVPYFKYYDFESNHPDIEAIKEAYAYFFVHKQENIDSPLAPSLTHNQAEWYQTIKRLKDERILRLPPEAAVVKETSGSRRWYSAWGLFSQTDGSKDEKEKKGVGCFPWFVLGVGALVLASQCGPLAAPQESQPQPSPSPLAAEKPAGAPVVGVINGVPTVEIRQTPEADFMTPETTVLTPPQAECDPGMEIITIEIKREGDSDANRIYRYPNRVNPAGDSAKGLFDKELVNSYVKDNPYSDTAIRYSLRNQRNEGRDVQASDPDLLALLDEARLFYGQPVTDSAYLSWVDSIKRNNPPGTIVGDLINATEFRSQDPRSLIRRLQAIPRS